MTFFSIFVLDLSIIERKLGNKINNITRWTVIGILGAYIAVIILLNIPFVQQSIGRMVSRELSKTLGSELSIGHVELGLPNRFILENVTLKDPSGEEMASIARTSAKISLMSLYRCACRKSILRLHLIISLF